AEDGIRDLIVTGVQTCALPIFFAVMTGPNGDSAAPLSGVKGSIFDVRIVGFLIAAVVLWIVSLGYEQVRPQVTEARTAINARGQIGRASCRERVWIEVVAGSAK